MNAHDLAAADFEEDVTRPYELSELAELGRQLGATIDEPVADVRLVLDVEQETFTRLAELAARGDTDIPTLVRRLVRDHIDLNAMVERARRAQSSSSSKKRSK